MNENKKVRRITKEQLKGIIKEGVQNLHKRTLLENEKKELMEELGMIGGNEENDVYIDDWNGKIADVIVSYKDGSEDNFEVPVDGEAGWFGSYRAATLYEPKEYPEFESNWDVDAHAIKILPDGSKEKVILPDNLRKKIEDEVYKSAQSGAEGGYSPFFKNPEYD